jgi:hypothetical protein
MASENPNSWKLIGKLKDAGRHMLEDVDSGISDISVILLPSRLSWVSGSEERAGGRLPVLVVSALSKWTLSYCLL